jgi:predicted DNA-binding protein (MmcQ/YjbR family)
MDFEKAKALCLSFPGCTDDVKWESNLVFSVGLKMFAVTDTATPASGISFKVDDERFLELTAPALFPRPTWRAPNGCMWKMHRR